MSAAERWEKIARYLYIMGGLLVLFAGYSFFERDVTGGFMTLVPAAACGLFGYFAQLRHDKIAFGTPTPIWLVVAALVAAGALIPLGLLSSLEDADREARIERAQAEPTSYQIDMSQLEIVEIPAGPNGEMIKSLQRRR